MSDRGARWLIEGRYDTMQNQCSQRLYTLCERIFPLATKTYCLYSCRHQFVANMKELMTPAEVSAMVGHHITITAIDNYGRNRSAWGDRKNVGWGKGVEVGEILGGHRLHKKKN